MAANSPIAENRIALAGRLIAEPHVRHSPAGIPVARFALEHDSLQREGGVMRRQCFRVGVRAVGVELCEQLRGVVAGHLIRVFGHLTRSSQADEDYKLLICAEKLAVLEIGEPSSGA